jgi:2-dehydropantoate 2-reductase
MKFHVLGVGAIGGLIAHNLRRVLPAEFSITLIHKNVQDHLRLRKKGAYNHRTLWRGGQLHRLPARNIQRTSPPPSTLPKTTLIDAYPALRTTTGPIHSLFVALKAHQTLDAVRAVASRLTPHSTVVLLQNGMGVYESLLADVFRNPAQRPHFILTSISHGAFATDFYRIVHAGVGSIEFAIAPDPQGRDFEAGLHDQTLLPQQRRLRLTDISLPKDPQSTRYHSLRSTVAALLLLENLHTSWQPFSALQLAMRRKLTVNAVINPLTALLDCRNGDLFEHEQARELLTQICDEASSVFMAQMAAETESWINDLQADGIDTSTVQAPVFPEALTSEALQTEVLRVATITRQNISSMLADVRRGRTTEINFLNGYLEDLGREHGVNTPVNSVLANLVRLKSVMPLNLV